MKRSFFFSWFVRSDPLDDPMTVGGKFANKGRRKRGRKARRGTRHLT